MASQSQSERRARRRDNQPNPLAVFLVSAELNGEGRRLPAVILDISDAGIKVQLRAALVRDATYRLETSATLAARVARVTWCRSSFSSLFHAGLAFVEGSTRTPEAEPAAEEDLYEILQVNPKATPDTIHRVYRILAQRYHPDNHDTGDEGLFKGLTRAYQALSDPELRAAYDLRREQFQRTRTRVFTSVEATQGKQSERRKRVGVLNALYSRRVLDPVNPALSVFDFEDLLGIPREHLEFTLWYLKERAYVTRSDNNRFQITINGVDYAESLEQQDLGSGTLRSDRLLPSA
jgi:hypothetical protein